MVWGKHMDSQLVQHSLLKSLLFDHWLTWPLCWKSVNQIYVCRFMSEGFPDNSVGKVSTCIEGDPSLIPGLRRSTGEEIGYPLQYSWTLLVAQLVKNPSAMRETWIRSLDCEDPLEKGKATHSSILAWRIPWTIRSMGLQRIGHNWAPFTFTLCLNCLFCSTDLFICPYANITCVCAKPLQSCQTLFNPLGCSQQGSSVHGILQARILQWVAIPSSRECQYHSVLIL